MYDLQMTTSASRIAIDGTDEIVDVDGIDHARAQTITIARKHAERASKTITVKIAETAPTGITEHTLKVSPDGTVEEFTPEKEATKIQTVEPKTEPENKPEAQEEPATEPEPTAAPKYAMTSFLEESRPWIQETLWQRLLRKVGVDKSPSPEQIARKRDETAVSQAFAGPRSIAIINGKGGAGKTPATIFLAAQFARLGGGQVLAWDRNITRGTLGWRTQQGPHSATTLDLLPRVDFLLTAEARAADLAAFTHHQIEDKFDVLRSNPLLLSTDQKLSISQFDALHKMARKFHRLVFMDSGNDEGDALWLRMIDQADAIVIPTSTKADTAEAARLLLEGLRGRDDHSRELADNAVIIVSQASPEPSKESAAKLNQVAAVFEDNPVITIPYDPAIEKLWLHVDALSPVTERAWLHAAAELARKL